MDRMLTKMMSAVSEICYIKSPYRLRKTSQACPKGYLCNLEKEICVFVNTIGVAFGSGATEISGSQERVGLVCMKLSHMLASMLVFHHSHVVARDAYFDAARMPVSHKVEILDLCEPFAHSGIQVKGWLEYSGPRRLAPDCGYVAMALLVRGLKTQCPNILRSHCVAGSKHLTINNNSPQVCKIFIHIRTENLNNMWDAERWLRNVVTFGIYQRPLWIRQVRIPQQPVTQ
jgi:hypothetical protein